MDAVFLKLFNLSLEAAWLILAVLVLRLVLTRAQKSVRCLMWGIVGLRLIFPFSVESVISLLPSKEVISTNTVRYDPAPTIHTGVQVFDNAVNPTFSQAFAAQPAASVNPLHVITTVAAWVWLVGMVVMIAYFIISAISLKRRVSGAVEVENRIWESDKVPSPFVFGLVDPRVYLPTGMDTESRKYVVAHELAHIRRRDYLFKPLAFLVLAVYWFNPLVWVAYILLCRDIELACDEYVLTELGVGCKKAYSEALLAAVTFHRHVAACPVAFGEGKLTQRVKNVLRWKKPVLWLSAISLLLCAVLAVCFLTDPKGENGDGVNADTDFVSYTPMGWRLNVSENGVARICDNSTGETRGDEVWRGEGFDMYVMWNDFNGNYALLRQDGKYKALDIRAGVLYDIELEGGSDAVLAPHNDYWEGPFWLLLDVSGGDIALYTVGDECACPSSDSEFYNSLFEKSLQHDAATSEELDAVYAEIFDRDTERFLIELGIQGEEVQNHVAFSLVYGKSAGDFEAFRETVESLPAYSNPAGLALSKITDAIADYEANASPDYFPMNEDHSRWAQTFAIDSGIRQVTVNDSSGNEQTVPVPEGYGDVSCEPLCWIGENTLLVEGAYPDGTVTFIYDARTGVSDELGSKKFYEKLFCDDFDSDFYISRRVTYYPPFIEADAKAFLHGLAMVDGTAEFVETNLDIAAEGAAADAETADRFDALMQALWDDNTVGELAQALSGKINSLMADKTADATPPTYEGVPQRQEAFVWEPETPASALGLTAMHDWVPSKPLDAGAVLPELTGSQIPGFDALPDMSKLHEWEIAPKAEGDADIEPFLERTERAAKALWGTYGVEEIVGGFTYSPPSSNGFYERIRLEGISGGEVVISFRAGNEYTEDAPYYTGRTVSAGEALEAAREMSAAFGFESLTAEEPVTSVYSNGQEHGFDWYLPYDGLNFDTPHVHATVICGKVTSFWVELPAIAPVTEDAPRYYLTPEQALYCVNYARSQTREADDLHLLLDSPTPVSVTLRWSGSFTNDSNILTPVYYFDFEGNEYMKEGVLWRDTCTAAVDAYTGQVHMTTGWEEWESPYSVE